MCVCGNELRATAGANRSPVNAGATGSVTDGHIVPMPSAPYGAPATPAPACVVAVGGNEGCRWVITVKIGIITGVERKGPQKAWAKRLAGVC